VVCQDTVAKAAAFRNHIPLVPILDTGDNGTNHSTLVNILEPGQLGNSGSSDCKKLRSNPER
jgi:hypothetical protein